MHTHKTIIIKIADKPTTKGIRDDSDIDIPFAQSKDSVPTAPSLFYTWKADKIDDFIGTQIKR